MVTVGDIYNYIDTFAPFHTAMGFDNVGLLVGEKHCPVTSVIVSMGYYARGYFRGSVTKRRIDYQSSSCNFSAVKETVSNICAVFVGTKRLMCYCSTYQLRFGLRRRQCLFGRALAAETNFHVGGIRAFGLVAVSFNWSARSRSVRPSNCRICKNTVGVCRVEVYLKEKLR